MQITLSSTTSSAVSNASQGQASLPKEGGFSSLLFGSVQQSSQNADTVNQANQNTEDDLSALLAVLLKPADESNALGTFVDEKTELVNMAEELVEKGEMPSLQELAVLLQTDVETLKQSLQSLLHSLKGSKEALELENKATNSSEPEEAQALPAADLAALIGQITETPLPLLKEADKPLVVTAVRAAQLINYFAEHLTKPDQRFQPLQTALKNAEVLLNQHTNNSSLLNIMKNGIQLPVNAADSLSQQGSNNPLPYITQNGMHAISFSQKNTAQSSLQHAFAHYSHAQEIEVSNTASLKPTVQIAESGNPFLHQLSKAEQFVMNVKTNPGPMNMEQFIEKFTQVLSNSNMMKMPNGTKMLIKLYPEQLGSLRIELLQQNGVMTAKILSSTQTVKELLEQNAHQLKHAFSQQSVTVDKIDIVSPETKQQLFDRGTPQQRQQEQKQPDRESSEANDKNKSSTFEEALQNVELEV